jgi:hypothetical protein
VSEEEIKINRQTENKYNVTFSEFDGHVEVSTYQGKISEVRFMSKRMVSAPDLRKFPLQAVEYLIKNDADCLAKNKVTKKASPTKLTTKPRKLTTEFLTLVSEKYIDALAQNKRPLLEISLETGAPRNTVARWVARARKEGILT